MKQFTELWDREVRTLAEDVLKTCKSDPCVTHYVGQMIFYVEHDLSDGRGTAGVGILVQEALDRHHEAVSPRLDPTVPLARVHAYDALGKKLKELEATL